MRLFYGNKIAGTSIINNNNRSVKTKTVMNDFLSTGFQAELNKNLFAFHLSFSRAFSVSNLCYS